MHVMLRTKPRRYEIQMVEATCVTVLAAGGTKSNDLQFENSKLKIGTNTNASGVNLTYLVGTTRTIFHGCQIVHCDP